MCPRVIFVRRDREEKNLTANQISQFVNKSGLPSEEEAVKRIPCRGSSSSGEYSG
jgi:hypothetical protein